MRAAIGKAQLAELATNREAHVVAVMPRLEHADGGPDQVVRVRKTADAAQLVDHDAPLQLELERVLGMLPATAAATSAVIRTGRLDSPRRGPLDGRHLGAREVTT